MEGKYLCLRKTMTCFSSPRLQIAWSWHHRGAKSQAEQERFLLGVYSGVTRRQPGTGRGGRRAGKVRLL